MRSGTNMHGMGGIHTYDSDGTKKEGPHNECCQGAGGKDKKKRISLIKTNMYGRKGDIGTIDSSDGSKKSSHDASAAEDKSETEKKYRIIIMC